MVQKRDSKGSPDNRIDQLSEPSSSETTEKSVTLQEPTLVVGAIDEGHTEVKFAVDEMELLIAYLSRSDKIITPSLLESSIKIRNRYCLKEMFSNKEEFVFWSNYHQLIDLIKPATLASIQQTRPSPLWKKRNVETLRRVKRVPFYYGTAVFITILLSVSLQSYYMVGVNVIKKTTDLFSQRNEVRVELAKALTLASHSESPTQSSELLKLRQLETQLDQEFDATRILLFDWNNVWILNNKEARFSLYDDFVYKSGLDKSKEAIERERAKLSQLTADLYFQQDEKIQKEKNALNDAERERHLNMSRSIFYRNLLLAEFMLDLLSSHVLPLLFGCLGAFTLVLRSIHNAFQQGTFTLNHRLDYNLRIVLGGVMGISSGLFFGEGGVASTGQYSPIVIAFLIGYNVEILFSIMDNLARRLAVDSSDPEDKKSDDALRMKNVDNRSDNCKKMMKDKG